MNTSWRPDAVQLRWTEGLIIALKDGATWFVPAVGNYVLDKKAKTLTLTKRLKTANDEMHARIEVAFEQCGYRVLDKAAPLAGKENLN